MPKGMKCDVCGKSKVKSQNGIQRCRGCQTMRWTIFSRPSAGRSRKGYRCFNCTKKTLHPVGGFGGGAVRVLRCSTCGSTRIEYSEAKRSQRVGA